MISEKLNIGEAYTKNQLKEIFSVGDSGGIRYSKKNNSLVLTQVINDNPYPDSIDWENNTVDYVGTGNYGDQSVNYRENRRVFKSNQDNTTMYLFVRDRKNHNIYFGKAELVDTIYNMHGLDKNSNNRKLVVFRLKLDALYNYKDREKLNNIYNQIFDEKQIKDEVKINEYDEDTLLKEVKEHEIDAVNNGKSVIKIPSKTTRYERNQALVKLAKIFADGKCQLCGLPAPFNDKNGNPFLEVHHIDWLSRGGKDSIYNVIAICPNCHRRMHQLQNKEDIQKLKRKAKYFAKSNGFGRLQL